MELKMSSLGLVLTLALLNTSIVFVSSFGGMLGGYTDHNVNLLSEEDESYYSKAAQNAVELMNINRVRSESTQNNLPIKFKELVHLKTQVIAGTNFDMVMKVLLNGKTETCHLLVTHLVNVPGGTWSVHAMTDSDPCAAYAPPEVPMVRLQKRSAHLLGGDREVTMASKDVKAAVQWALEEANARSNSFFRQGLLKVENIKRQVINGYRYQFQMTTVSTECRNNPENKNKDLKECPINKNAKPQDCDVSVIHSINKEYEMERFSCQASAAKPILGGDDHDYKPHGLLGGDDHDYKPHGLLGRTGPLRNVNDFLPKGRPYFALPEDMKKFKSDVTHMNILGGDDHDYVPHGNSDKCAEHKEAFKLFKAHHSKVYGSAREEAKRFMIFCTNMEKVKEYQSQEKGSAVYGASKFADLSEKEFKKQYLGLSPASLQRRPRLPQAKIPQGPIPDNWDWRDHGAVTPVKNQGSCGSCWAFSTTGNIEGQWAIVNKKLFSLSEQELVDCDKLDEGCNGGLPSLAYESIMKLGGLETERDYSYDGYDERCKFNVSKVVASVAGAVNISQNETEMAAWLYQNGPISIGINAFAMQFYMGGIAHPWRIFCNPDDLDHGVLIVGYGVERGEPFWIVKNSWGSDWGRQGYYYVYRGDGTCGLNTMCTSAQVKKQ